MSTPTNRNQVSFSDDEYDQLANLLSILQVNLVKGAQEIESICPQTRIAEQLRMQAEQTADYIDRIEAR